ncbi:MAG TPA: choice-of-anchor Q domain-containing protein [Polyangiaceae bacterium]|nr:choice-of-anchor Q domain-containing protein [Polyangiaceae bacterium]
MSRTLWALALGLVPAVLPLACGSLNKGEVVIVDEAAGSQNVGGTTSGSAGKAGSTAGGRGGTAGGTSGGTSGDSGEAGVGTGASGGSTGKGGSTAKGGSTGKGGSSNGDAGTGGGGGEPPSGCTESSECVASAPICDDGTCRGCDFGHMPDECSDFTNNPYCNDEGRCVACRTNDDCSTGRPVCEEGACRGCKLGSECDSGACNSGRCADETAVVYALAVTGSYAATCGTKTLPCISLTDAVSKLSKSRPFLVLLETPGAFDYTNVTLPPMIDIWIFGNGVTVGGYNAPVFAKAGGNLLLDGVVAIASQSGTSATSFAAVNLTSVSLKMVRSKIANDSEEYQSTGLTLTDSTADIHVSEFVNSKLGILSGSTLPLPTQGLTVERCLFQNNNEAIHVDADYFVIRNNLFISNGNTSYVRIIQPSAQNTGIFAYNTLYQNDNNCSYEGGLIACNGSGTCGIHSSNLFWGNMYNGSGGTACYDQVYGYPTTISYTMSELPYAGTGNIGGEDPLFVDPVGGDYSLSMGSPGIDAGDTDPMVMPDVDYYGNPRPLGGTPDIGAVESE